MTACRQPLQLCILLLLVWSPPGADRAFAEEDRPPFHPFEIHYAFANIEFTLLHEMAHALIAELGIPLLGREEDAADQMAAMLLRAAPSDGSRVSIVGKLNAVGLELRLEASEDSIAYWDSHPPAVQRFYNLLCLAYGMNPAALSDYLGTGWLPWDRGWYCGEEYQQAERAMLWVYQNYGNQGGREPQAPGRGARRGSIAVEYEIPASPGATRLVEAMLHAEIAEQLARQLEKTFELPRDLVISFVNCGDDAYWHATSGAIVVCYRLLEQYLEHAMPARSMDKLLPARIAPMEVVIPSRIYDALKTNAAEKQISLNDLAVEALMKYLEVPPR
ncbi:MAG: hypothetical protein IH614_13240 [Desulfuromonadales bacterium]|nr:hypothetical protein [Desulfuromonadales bacterium]